MKTQPKNLSAGVTLIELMVTVTLTALILVVGIPNFRTTIQQNSYTSQANEFLGALSFARAEAVKRADRVTMCKVKSTDAKKCDASGAWTDGWVIFVDSASQFSGTATTYSPTTTELLRVHGPLKNATLSDANSSNVANYVSFIASGVSQLGNGGLQTGKFQLVPTTSGATAVRCINLNAGGRAWIFKGGC